MTSQLQLYMTFYAVCYLNLNCYTPFFIRIYQLYFSNFDCKLAWDNTDINKSVNIDKQIFDKCIQLQALKSVQWIQRSAEYTIYNLQEWAITVSHWNLTCLPKYKWTRKHILKKNNLKHFLHSQGGYILCTSPPNYSWGIIIAQSKTISWMLPTVMKCWSADRTIVRRNTSVLPVSVIPVCQSQFGTSVCVHWVECHINIAYTHTPNMSTYH